MRRCTAIAACLSLAIAGLATSHCQRSPSSSTAPGTQPQNTEARIVSLSPAITRTLVDFDLQSKIIGRTPHCFSIDKSVPVVGDLVNINYETLVRLNPTHILVQPPAGGVDASLRKIAQEHGWKIASWQLNSLDDIEAMVREIPAALFPPNSPALQLAARRAAEIENGLAQSLSPAGKPLFRGRVLMVSSNNPVLAFGSGTYMGDILSAFGCTNAVAANGWVQLSMEDVVRLDPQALIIVWPGYNLAGGGIIEAAGQLWSLDMSATRDRRIGVIANYDSFLPSSAIGASAEELRDALQLIQENSPLP